MWDQVIKALLDSVDAGDYSALTKVFHPDIVYERPGYEPLVGIERLLEFYRSERMIASGVHHPWHIVATQDAGACWGHFTGTAKDGSEINERFADCYTFEQGKIKTRISYFFRPAI
jgi:ketosteroid isomerase-like protein